MAPHGKLPFVALLDELAAREAAMRWLDERTLLGTQPVKQPDVANFPFHGETVSLLLRQQGICKPRQLEAASPSASPGSSSD